MKTPSRVLMLLGAWFIFWYVVDLILGISDLRLYIKLAIGIVALLVCLIIREKPEKPN